MSVFETVNENHGDHLPVFFMQLLVIQDGAFLDRNVYLITKIAQDFINDALSNITQMTFRFANESELHGSHWMQSAHERERLLLLVATLVARLTQQLAVLLLCHALATLLDD